MNIGDLFLSLRADGAQLSKDVTAQGSKAGTGFGKSFAAGIKDQLKGGIAGGLGLGVGLGAVGLATTAVSKLGDVLGDAVQAARDDEASQQKLKTALLANVDAWDGNTKAIEDVIEARRTLGFSDEEQRDSLAKLVAVYHDVASAQDVQRTAMDLARLRSISLSDATDALVTVEAGQWKLLKKLGIQLPKNASAQDALNAVQKVAQGQAEDFSKTAEGRLIKAQDDIGESLEKLGYTLLPAVSGAMDVTAQMVADLAGNLDGLQKAADTFLGTLDELSGAQADASDSGLDLVHTAEDFLSVWDPSKVSQKMGFTLDIIDKLGINTRQARDQLNGLGLDLPSASKAFNDSYDAIEHARGALNRFTDVTHDAGGALDDATTAADHFSDALDGIYGATSIHGRQAGIRQQIIDTEKDLKAAKKAGDKLEVARLQGQLADLHRDLVESWEAGQKLGDKPSSDALTKWLNARISQAGKYGAILGAVLAQQGSLGNAPGRRGAPSGAGQAGVIQSGGHAAGGFIPANAVGTVGERGIEGIRTLPGGGAVITRHRDLHVPSTGYPSVDAASRAIGVPRSGPPVTYTDNSTINVGTMDRRTMPDVMREHRRRSELAMMRMRIRVINNW